jgi:hypothetical protein
MKIFNSEISVAHRLEASVRASATSLLVLGLFGFNREKIVSLALSRSP